MYKGELKVGQVFKDNHKDIRTILGFSENLVWYKYESDQSNTSYETTTKEGFRHLVGELVKPKIKLEAAMFKDEARAHINPLVITKKNWNHSSFDGHRIKYKQLTDWFWVEQDEL